MIGSLTLTEVECADCITHFALDESLRQRCLETGRSFYCPNGHSNWYKGNELDRLKRERQALLNRTSWAEEEAERAKREKTAIKGQLTKTRNRIANGVCPCCHRTFKQLARHIGNKHPDFKKVYS